MYEDFCLFVVLMLAFAAGSLVTQMIQHPHDWFN